MLKLIREILHMPQNLSHEGYRPLEEFNLKIWDLHPENVKRPENSVENCTVYEKESRNKTMKVCLKCQPPVCGKII